MLPLNRAGHGESAGKPSTARTKDGKEERMKRQRRTTKRRRETEHRAWEGIVLLHVDVL